MDQNPALDSDPALFVSGFQDVNKNKFFKVFFCFLIFDGTFTLVFKDKSRTVVIKQ